MTNALVIGYLSGIETGSPAYAVPPVIYTDLPTLLDYASEKAGRCEEITVVVTNEAATAMHLPAAPDLAAYLLNDVYWTHGPLGPWMTFYRPGRRIHLGFWPWMAKRPRDHALFADQLDQRYTSPKAILDRLVDWYDYTLSAYRGIPGVAGTALLRKLVGARKGHPPLWHAPTPDGIHPNELEISRWRSPVTPLRGENPGHLVSYDTNRAYLAAAGTVEVALDRLAHTGPMDFDVKRPGWWQIEADPWTSSRLLPDPLMRRFGGGPVWVTNPTVKLLDDLYPEGTGVPGYSVIDSWTADKAVRLFRPWAGCLNSMCMDLLPGVLLSSDARALLAAAKDSYRQTVGLMNRQGGAIYRPDWHHAIIAQARCTMWRKLWRLGHDTGRWPLTIATDAVTFQGASGDPVSENPGFPLGNKLSEWKTKTAVVTQ